MVEGRGLFRSDDGGAHWTQTSSQVPANATALAAVLEAPSGAAGEPCMECKTFVTVTPQDVFKPKFDEREFGIHLKHATDKVKLVVEAARKFVKSADEFFPEYPSGVTEPLDALVEAVNALGD